MRRSCWVAEFRIETERLILRDWREDDVLPLHQMCSDPRVMEFIGPPQSEDEVCASIAKQRGFQAEVGYCYWAIERRDDGKMIGFCGLMPMPDVVPIAPKIDIGWRLAAAEWGKGYAYEAAQAALAWGFETLDCDAIWAITVHNNDRSWGLMERLGMTRHSDLDFDHPNVPNGSPLKRHIAYSISRTAKGD
jgi:RimJ/RimL family protein N-acetyltransferase